MSNRNFDNRVIIQRLQQQTYARNLYQTNMNGQSLISNPQNSDSTSSRLTTFVSGAQTDYFRGLLGAGETVSLGGIFGISPFIPSIVPLTVPSAPTITAITDGNQQLVVVFTAPTSNGGSSITDYEYSTDNGGSFTAAGSTFSPLTITGLTNGTTYQVRIRAVNSIGNGAISNMVEGTPATVPSAPNIGTLIPGNLQLIVPFTASAPNGSAILYYEYQRTPGPVEFQQILDISGNTFTITGLTNGTSYSVVMRAHNSIGDSSPSNSASGIPATVPGIPIGLSITPGNLQLTVNFTAPANGGSAITNYKYSIDASGNFIALDPAVAASPITIPNSATLSYDTAYTVYIQAVNGIGNGPSSDGVSGTTLKEVPDIFPPPRGFVDLGVGIVEVGIRNFISFMPNIVNTVLTTTQGPYSPSEIRIVSSDFFYVRFENLRYQDPPNYRNYDGSSIILGNGSKTSAPAYFDFFVEV